MGILNFIKNLLGIETDADMIGLAKFSDNDFEAEDNIVKVKISKEPTLTELLQKAN